MTQENLRAKLYRIIFGTDTPAGKLFDLILIYSILLSVVALMLDSVIHIQERYSKVLVAVEWFFTLAFTAEYVVRLYCSPNRLRYATSFFGVIEQNSRIKCSENVTE